MFACKMITDIFMYRLAVKYTSTRQVLLLLVKPLADRGAGSSWALEITQLEWVKMALKIAISGPLEPWIGAWNGQIWS